MLGGETQLDLFEPLEQPEDPELDAGATIAEKFAAFHARNPHVYEAIVRMTRDLQSRGIPRLGMKMIFEQLRWRYLLQTSGSKYKLNNNYTAYYARLVMERHPDLEGFFELREKAE